MNLPEIDHLIAERVMGWHQRQFASGPHVVWADQNETALMVCATWKPTTDAAHAKQVRDKLAQRWDWLLGRGGKMGEKPFGFALYEKPSTLKEVAIDEADTEELAVCLCALRAFGIEVPA